MHFVNVAILLYSSTYTITLQNQETQYVETYAYMNFY